MLDRELGGAGLCFVMQRFCARVKHQCRFISRLLFIRLRLADLSLPIIRVRHYDEEHIDCETAFTDHCAIQSIDSLSNHHCHHTNPAHLHRSRQDTNRTDSPMHSHRKSPHISNSALEKPYRLRINFSPSFPNRGFHHHCSTDPLAIPGSHQFGPLFSHLQEGIYH